MSPPNKITIDMQKQDVEKNLVDIVKGMENLRRECLVSLQQDDISKMHYLRFSAELASCLEPKLTDNIELYVRKLMQSVKRDSLLLRYDDIQESFWDKRQPKFKDSLDRATILLLNDNFTSTSQSYHVFQGIKYLHASEDKETVYDTILPFNSLLLESSLSDPVVAEFVMNHLFKGYMEQAGNGIVLDNNNLHNPEFIARLKELGALHVDLPQNAYSKMKNKFHAIVVEEDGVKKTRVFLRNVDGEIIGINLFDFMEDYAVKELSEKSEKNINSGIRSHYSFGKKFVEEMQEKLGINVKPVKIKKTINNILTLDEVAAENNAYKTQEQWIEYWNRFEDRWFPSMPELYQVFKQITGDSKVNEKLLTSLRNDFEKGCLLCSTRINYNPNDKYARMIHNFGSKMQKEPIDLEIPLYRGEEIEDVLKQSKGFNYLRQLLQTEDSEEEIIKVFEKLNNKSKDKIHIWTPPQYGRKDNRERAVSLNYDIGAFHINGYNFLYINYAGYSRSVATSAASLEAR